MASTEEQLREHIFRLVHVVRNAASYSTLSRYLDELKQNYWILIFNNFFDIAILEWCKIFGTDSEPTHWKKLVHDHDSFRQGLLSHLGVSENEWKAYWEEVKAYRDNLISHHQKNPNVTHYPTLDKALKAVYYYYDWLIKKLRDIGNNQYPDSLKDYYDRFLDQAQEFSDAAYGATKDITEKVY